MPFAISKGRRKNHGARNRKNNENNKISEIGTKKKGLKMSSEDKNGQIVALIHRILVIVEI